MFVNYDLKIGKFKSFNKVITNIESNGQQGPVVMYTAGQSEL